MSSSTTKRAGPLEELFRFGGYAEVPVADTSASTQASNAATAARLIVLTGALTDDRTVVLQQRNTGADWEIQNATTGGFTVTVRLPTGTSVAIPAGVTWRVIVTPTGLAQVDAAGGNSIALSSDQRGSAGLLGVYSRDGSGGTDTLATFTFSGAATVWLFEVDVAMVTDDGADAYVGKFVRGVLWTGSEVGLVEVGSSTAVFENFTSALAASFDIAISGSTVQLQCTGVVDWRWSAAVRVTRMKL